MKVITPDMFEAPLHGVRYGNAEASTLGLAPGEWPYRFEVATLGIFSEHYFYDDGSIVYKNETRTAFFTIWND